jgi:hypothetical protein
MFIRFFILLIYRFDANRWFDVEKGDKQTRADLLPSDVTKGNLF